MDMKSVIKHLILKEACFPALKLVWNKQIDAEDFGELPKLTPTHYLKENRLSTDDRHKLLSRQQRKISSRTPGAEVSVEPPIIVFQNYKFGETYTFPIIVRNISKNSQKVAILMDESFVFKFNECSQRVAKFPCGMCITAAVTFTPENPMEDYYHKLVISTNTTKVVVPIIGIGPRPLLNAPDSVLFTDSPVRYWTVKPVNVLNIGKKPAKFALAATGSFCIKPEKGEVLPNEAFTFEVAYFSPTVATHEGEICIRYDNGEEIYIYLRANAVNADIKLSSHDVRCEDTYMSLQTRSTIYIENNSDITVKFYWKTLPEYDDMLRFYGRCDECPHQWRDGEGLEDALERGESKPISYELDPQCEDLVQSVKDRPDDIFVRDNFQLHPVFGEIKPHSKVEVQVIFSPKECTFYEGKAYLEVNGLEKRIPFAFYGRGLGPKFRLGFEVLSVGDVALGGTHTYEVPVQNVSPIPGTIRCEGLVGLPSGMGMKVEPLQLDIDPDQYGAFYVMFHCTGKPGDFQDEVKFLGKDSGDTFYVTVTGQITYPRIRFTVAETHMGNLSYGFPKTFSIPLVNDSLNYVNVNLKMAKDGVDPPIDFNTIISSFKNEKFVFDNNPSEFKVAPMKFTLKPRGIQRIELTMYPNHVREVKNQLKCLILDNSGHEVESVATVTIRGTVIVPRLEVVKDNVHMKECYLHYPYPTEFIIRNPGELPVVYCIIHKPIASIDIITESFVGIADPWVDTTIPFDVMCNTTGDSHLHFDLYAVGNEDKITTLNLKVESIPSRVEASAKSVDFGRIEVLEEKICSVDVVNTSPLDFPFTAQLFDDDFSGNDEEWRAEPESGVLPSQSRVSFSIFVLMKEVGWHYSAIRIQMSEPLKHTIEIKMKALGVGSPLKFTPPLQSKDIVDFGIIFVKQEKTLEYEIYNRGVNPRVLEWKPGSEKGPLNKPDANRKMFITEKRDTNTKIEKSGKTGSTRTAKSGKASRAASTTATKKGPEKEKKLFSKEHFVIQPMQALIPPGGTLKMTITSQCHHPRKLEEMWNLWTYVPASKHDDVPRRTTIGQTLTQGQTGKPKGKGMPVIAPPKAKANATPPKRPPSEQQNLHLKPTILCEAKFQAHFELPGLRFSKKVVRFFIEAKPTYTNFVATELLKIENVGFLPLRVRLKTKFPFSYRSRQDEHEQEDNVYELDVKKFLVIKLRFDGQHLRKELGQVVFDGKLDATCEGFLGTESIELVGEVKFPELTLERTLIDFGTITNGMEAVEQLTVYNYGNCCLTYKWYIKPGTTHIQKHEDVDWSRDVYFGNFRASINTTTHLKLLKYDKLGLAGVRRMSMDERRRSREMDALRSRDHFSQVLGVRSDIQSSYEDFTSFIKEKMYRTRMMEFMGLKDAEYEAEDEVNYLSFYNQGSFLPKDEFNTNELVDIIPLAGVVQAGQSQTFTVVFYGHPDITFNTTLILYVEGGARKNVQIRGATVPPQSPGLIGDSGFIEHHEHHHEHYDHILFSSKENVSLQVPSPIVIPTPMSPVTAANATMTASSDKDDDTKSNQTGISVKTA